MTLDDIRNVITANLEATPGVGGAYYYDDDLAAEDLRLLAQDAPGILIEDGATEIGDDYGTGYQGMQLDYSVYVLIWRNASSPRRMAMDLGTKLAQKIERHNWGLADLGLASIREQGYDDFRPEWDDFIVWKIDFTHSALLKVAA